MDRPTRPRTDREPGEEAAGRAPGPAYRPSPYRSAPWLPGPHAQTLGARLLRRPRLPAFRRERLPTPDGDRLELDRLAGAPDASDVLILHGLEGSSASGYVRELVRRLREMGLHAACLNFRSCGGAPNRRRRFYHAGETSDLLFVLELLVALRGGRPMGAAGFSLGGNVLLRALEERGAEADRLIAAAAAVSVPFDLAAAAARMERLPGSLYAAAFLSSLRASVEAKARLRDVDLPLEAVRAARTLREFDDVLTAPLHGFSGAAEYYRRSSSGGEVERIAVPTLVIQARDDPFVPPGTVPEAAMAAHPWVTPLLLDRGGHVGFVEGPGPWDARFFGEREVARFLAAHLATGSATAIHRESPTVVSRANVAPAEPGSC